MHVPHNEWSSQQSSQCSMRFARTKICFRLMYKLQCKTVGLFHQGFSFLVPTQSNRFNRRVERMAHFCKIANLRINCPLCRGPFQRCHNSGKREQSGGLSSTFLCQVIHPQPAGQLRTSLYHPVPVRTCKMIEEQRTNPTTLLMTFKWLQRGCEGNVNYVQYNQADFSRKNKPLPFCPPNRQSRGYG